MPRGFRHPLGMLGYFPPKGLAPTVPVSSALTSPAGFSPSPGLASLFIVLLPFTSYPGTDLCFFKSPMCLVLRHHGYDSGFHLQRKDHVWHESSHAVGRGRWCCCWQRQAELLFAQVGRAAVWHGCAVLIGGYVLL